MEVSSACNVRTSDLVVRRFGSKKIYASQNQRGNRINSDNEESLIAKFGNALRAFLHVKDAQLQFSDRTSLPCKEALSTEFNQDTHRQSSDCTSLPGKDAQLLNALATEYNLDHPKLLITPPTEEVLHKSGDVHCAENTPLMILSENAPLMEVSVDEGVISDNIGLQLSVDEEDKISDSISLQLSVDEEDDSVSLLPIEEHSESLVCEQPASLPIALAPKKELISAMKGTREKLGIMPMMKLTVTWSPDVYDPPVTSVTHTVSGHHHHHRSRSKKTGTSSKRHKGGKSSQGGSSGSSKRHQKHSGKSDHHHRSKSSSSSSPPKATSISERSVFGGYNSTLDLVDYESTCGSSFLGKSVAEVLAPVAEAK